MRLCECGCGNPTGIAAYTSRQAGFIKGQPKRFLPHHHLDAARRAKRVKVRWVVDTNGCWVWQLGLTKRGYARDVFDGRRQFVYKRNYEEKYGVVPDGYELDHTCEVKACVNPDHMEPVLHTINVRRGNRAVLNMNIAREIRALYAKGGLRQKDVGEIYGIAQSQVSAIIRNAIWKEGIDGEPTIRVAA